MNDVIGISKGRGWILGKEGDGDAITDYFYGTMDEVAFYHGELTKEEIASLYQDGVKVQLNDKQYRYHYNELNELIKEETKESDGLLAYYSFDNSDGKDIPRRQSLMNMVIRAGRTN